MKPAFGLVSEAEGDAAMVNIVLSVILCLVAVWIGYMIGGWLNRLQGA